MLKFVDAKKSKLLPLSFTRADEADVPLDKVIVVSSDKPGWLVTAKWIDTTTKAWDPAAVSKSAATGDELRLGVYAGDPSANAAGTNKLALEQFVTVGKAFEFNGEHSPVVSGLVSRGESGKLHFRGNDSAPRRRRLPSLTTPASDRDGCCDGNAQLHVRWALAH